MAGSLRSDHEQRRDHIRSGRSGRCCRQFAVAACRGQHGLKWVGLLGATGTAGRGGGADQSQRQ